MIGVSTNILSDSARKMKYYQTNEKSADFAGSDDGFTIADDDDFSMTDGSNNDKPFSLSMWIKQDVSGTGGTANGLLIGKCTTSSTKEYKLFLHYGQLLFDIQDNTDQIYKRVTAEAQTINNPPGVWHHIVATYNGNENSTGMRLYRDGLELSTTPGQGGTYVGMPNTASKVAIGHRLDNDNYDFDGHMKDICIWKDYELNQAEVSAMYNDGEFSVDPTVDQGVYDGASYLKLWLKCEDRITQQAASSSTNYEAIAANKCGGQVIPTDTDEYAANCAGLNGIDGEGIICCKSTTTTAAILGTSDSSGNNHHATDTGDGVSIVTDSPTTSNPINEY